MKIIGIGVDIVENNRIKTSIKKKSFVNRIFGKQEIIISKKIINKTNYFSKRFGAKEAFVKALGTGFRNGLNFKDIQILNNNLGKPYYLINSKIKNLIKKVKKVENFELFLSISDEKEYSVAFTIIQKKNK
jgi:holo-[acyl-carrier protein] synthase